MKEVFLYHLPRVKTLQSEPLLCNILSQAPDRHLILDSVPSWFTLKAPDKGWKTLPTQKQLRIMMKDSSN